ncbi:transketolase [Streptomyces scopuliridis]|uniref:transketolase n=1 Tax=Streptomyces scopuliridis TaxID=452529 RepID=UPI0035DF30AE
MTATAATLLDRFEQPARLVMARLTDEERVVVERELAELGQGRDYGGSAFAALRALAAAVPDRLYDDSARVLLRMHEIAGSGNYQSCLSSLPTVRACFDLGLVPDQPDDGDDGVATLVVGRGHIAPSFYAERYVRGGLPFLPLTTLHKDGLSGVVHRDWGFRNTMRYSLGVGLAQAVSLALDLRRRGDRRKVVCLAGDGELQEGVTFECLRFAHEAGLDNLLLVVDANGRGIEPLRAPVSRDYLATYLGPIVETDGRDPAAVHKTLQELLDRPGSAVLLCRTRKEGHSFKLPAPPGAPPSRPSFANTAGGQLAEFQRATGRRLAVFTADMAARFGLPDRVGYENVGLAETLSVGLTLSLPEDVVKVVATDGMYYMDSLSMLTEATTSVRNLMVLAGRSWGAWGGAANAVNLLDLVVGTRVYEPVTVAEFRACAERLLLEPDTAHVVSMIDARFTEPAADAARDIDGGIWITEPPPDHDGGALVTFGYATVLVQEANRDLGLPHLHCAALRPEFDTGLVDQLRRFRRLLSVEYNAPAGGFGEGLRARYLLGNDVLGVEGDIHNCVHEGQLARHGFAPAQLAARLEALTQEGRGHEPPRP